MHYKLALRFASFIIKLGFRSKIRLIFQTVENVKLSTLSCTILQQTSSQVERKIGTTSFLFQTNGVCKQISYIWSCITIFHNILLLVSKGFLNVSKVIPYFWVQNIIHTCFLVPLEPWYYAPGLLFQEFIW